MIGAVRPASCRRLADRLGVDKTTVWRWRMRILATLERATDQLGGAPAMHGGAVDARDGPESVIGLFKTEVVKQLGPWKSAADVEWETMHRVDRWNEHSLLSLIGYVPPQRRDWIVPQSVV